ncbi:response regulator transcription factor [Cupriavidus pauculus]|uniref:DNA-binding response regulator n=1 Tax=Cupriavidus pauculus TaxID=82633 RepID=A0A2N5CDX0_9BURK|nr:response regulator transcription factor [Cupriavidus pauculus]PLQ00441.1 DNA-binding response regulator [Cupriavidus pauculus]
MELYRLKVVLADDHPAVLEGVRLSVAGNTVDVVATATNSTEIIRCLDDKAVDVLVTDYAMPGGEFGDGMQLLNFIIRKYPNLRIVLLTMLDNPGVIHNLIKIGIRCIVSKSDHTSHLLPAIHIASSGGHYHSPAVAAVVRGFEYGVPENRPIAELSRRESEVVRLFVSGMSVGAIATYLRRSKQTVSTQKSNAMKRIGVSNDAELIKYALEVGLAPASVLGPPQA